MENVRKPAESTKKKTDSAGLRTFFIIFVPKNQKVTLFYYEFIHKQRHGNNFWQAMQGKPTYNTWCGLAFERVCLWHIEQIKKKLGIGGIVSNEYAWQCKADKDEQRPGVQIDLLIERSDGIIDLCEMKYSKDKYVINEAYEKELTQKRTIFSEVSKTKSAVHTIMVTTHGIAHNAYSNEIQNEVDLDDLFQ